MKEPKKINFFAVGKKIMSNEIKALQNVFSKIDKKKFNDLCFHL